MSHGTAPGVVDDLVRLSYDRPVVLDQHHEKCNHRPAFVQEQTAWVQEQTAWVQEQTAVPEGPAPEREWAWKMGIAVHS